MIDLTKEYVTSKNNYPVVLFEILGGYVKGRIEINSELWLAHCWYMKDGTCAEYYFPEYDLIEKIS